MAFPLIPALALGASAIGALASRRKGKPGSDQFQFQPYTGYRPPAIDTDERQFLRPTQALTTDIVSRRAQGQDVGFDPARRTAQESLLRSLIDKRLEDDVRAAEGTASAAGLSSNLRAQEALAGRARRDASRTYGEGVANITIEDLARANQERDVNTSRLGALNEFNFGQENRRADFDLDIYGQEQAGRQYASGSAAEALGRRNELTSDILNTGIGAASLFLPDKGLISGPLLQNLVNQNKSGQGVAPTTSLDPTIYTSSGPGVRSLARRRIQGR